VNKASVLFVFGLACLTGHAQWIHEPTRGIPRTAAGKPDLAAPMPRTTDDKPDLSGIWNLRASGGGVSQLDPSEIKPWAEEVHKQRLAELSQNSPGTQCLPGSVADQGLTKIVQTPGLIVMLHEDLTYRQVFLDGRALPQDPNPAWMGYSVGHWDGDTLVVESTGYNDRTFLDDRYPHTENMRVTERIRRSDFGHLAIEDTRSDPAAYEKSWVTKTSGVYVADTELLEYVCAENEKDRVHFVGKNSDDTKNAVKLSPEILKKYVGTYEVPNTPGLLNVVLEDGGLKVSVNGGFKLLMTPLSETSFAGPMGAQIEFVKNENGDVTQMVTHLVEGDFPANRKK
jgi:hypothetical protein